MNRAIAPLPKFAIAPFANQPPKGLINPFYQIIAAESRRKGAVS